MSNEFASRIEPPPTRWQPARLNSPQSRITLMLIAALCVGLPSVLRAAAVPVRADRGMVVSQDRLATEIGVEILRAGGNAIDAAVATAFALAVVHPAAGNIGGGGFILYRAPSGATAAYDFREMAPARAQKEMFITHGVYDSAKHHESPLAVGVPGTVAGLHLAWKEHGRMPWKGLLQPAIRLADQGFSLTVGLADSLRAVLPSMAPYPASVAQFSKRGIPYEPGEKLRQPELARTLRRIASEGTGGFYDGPTAALVEAEMKRLGGLITRADLQAYHAKRREIVSGTYRGYRVLSMPPPSSGGVVLIESLNILEGFDLAGAGFASAKAIHWTIEALRRGFADRARYLGDPDFNPDLPVLRFLSKEYARQQRAGIATGRASSSETNRFEWPRERSETTHLSVVDAERGAVALTFTLEGSYGSRIVVPGAGFLLNNEMGDFNPWPGVTRRDGLIGTPANTVQPGKRMLSSMCPTILEKDGQLLLVAGSPGGRTIISTVLQIILNTVDFDMNAQEAVNAPRFHHQWLPDELVHERLGFSADTLGILANAGHQLRSIGAQGAAMVIRASPKTGRLEGAPDPRAPDAAAAGIVGVTE